MKLKQPPATLGRLPSAIKAPPKIAEDFYRSREWKQLMVHLKATRGPWCQQCGSLYRVAGDHIIERKDGGAELDTSNIELLCQACHNSKTKRRAAERVKTRL